MVELLTLVAGGRGKVAPLASGLHCIGALLFLILAEVGQDVAMLDLLTCDFIHPRPSPIIEDGGLGRGHMTRTCTIVESNIEYSPESP